MSMLCHVCHKQHDGNRVTPGAVSVLCVKCHQNRKAGIPDSVRAPVPAATPPPRSSTRAKPVSAKRRKRPRK